MYLLPHKYSSYCTDNKGYVLICNKYSGCISTVHHVYNMGDLRFLKGIVAYIKVKIIEIFKKLKITYF